MKNLAILIGNVCAKPELRTTTNGTAVATFTVACNEKYKDKQGNQQESCEFLRCIAWQRLGEICGEFLDKGSKVYCEGKNTIRKWKDNDGKDRYSHEIVLSQMKILSSKSESARGTVGNEPWPEPGNNGGSYGGGPSTGNDVPFSPIF